MNAPTPPPLSFEARARLRLVVTLLASLTLHIVLIEGLQFGAVEHGSPRTHVIEARLISPISRQDDQPALLKAIDHPVKTTAADWVPPTPAPAPRKPTPAPAPEAYREGMSKEATSATTIDAPLAADETYYAARDVDEHPYLVSGNKPDYPLAASMSNVKGEVLVLFLLNENGAVDKADIIEAKPPNQGFEEAVLNWLKQARFKPAIRKGRTVKSRVVYRVHFEPDS